MDRFLGWARREYSARQRLIALAFEGILFVAVIPALLVVTSAALDRWLQLPRFVRGALNPLVGLLCILPGGLLALWAVHALFVLGRGTPVPVMPTQQLVVRGPYACCRNPMQLGAVLALWGIGIWIGSPSALGLTLVVAAFLVAYIKLIEEKELEARFGPDYLEYKRRTPFLIPRLRRKT